MLQAGMTPLASMSATTDRNLIYVSSMVQPEKDMVPVRVSFWILPTEPLGLSERGMDCQRLILTSSSLWMMVQTHW